MKLAIIGVGLIGGSLGLCLKDKLGDKIFITGLCRTENSMQRAMELGAVDLATSNLEQVVDDADIIFLSPPVLQIVPDFRNGRIFLTMGTICRTGGLKKIMSASSTTSCKFDVAKSTAPSSIARRIDFSVRQSPVIKTPSPSLSFKHRPSEPPINPTPIIATFIANAP